MKEDKRSDRISVWILIVGFIISTLFLVWSFILSWTPELCETVGCLNIFIFVNMKAPLGAFTATIISYSARMLHVRFLQTQDQLKLAREQNVSNSFFMHKKALIEFCESLESKHEVNIDTEVVYNLLFPENSPVEMNFSLGIEKEHLVHPFIKSKEDLECGNIDVKMIAQLVFESYFFAQVTLGVKPKDMRKCAHIELHQDLMNHAMNNMRNAKLHSDSYSIIDKPAKIPLLSEKWGSSENKVALIVRSLGKFANVDLKDRRLSDKFAGFGFLDASLPKMQGIKIIPPEIPKA